MHQFLFIVASLADFKCNIAIKITKLSPNGDAMI